MGMKFPPQIDKATGRFLVAGEEESVKDSVYLILMTQKSERFTRPDYGSTTLSYTFMDTNPTSLHMMEQQMKETILAQEPRIAEIEIRSEVWAAKAGLIVWVSYILAHNQIGETLKFSLPLTGETLAGEEINNAR